MVTKMKYVTLSMIFIIIFIMFQFIGNSVDLLYSFNENEFASYKPQMNEEEIKNASLNYGEYMCFSNNLGYAAVICDVDENGKTNLPGITDACDYMKIQYKIFDSLSALDTSDMSGFSLLVIGKSNLDLSCDLEIITKFAQSGINTVFGILPDISLIEQSKELRQILGTHTIVSKECKLDGITIFENVLFGGKAILENKDGEEGNIEMTIPHFKLFAQTKAYVMGILKNQDEQGILNEDLPHILWRNTYNDSFVFVMNSDFFQHPQGIGFFVSILSEMCENFVYPVINAQTLSLLNYPTLCEENTQRLSEYYSQTIEYFFRINIFPSIVSISNQTGFPPTFFALSRFYYDKAGESSDTEYKDSIAFYTEQIRRIGGEIGLSGYTDDGTTSRLEKDIRLFLKYLPDYKFTVFNADNMDKNAVKDIVCDDGLLSEVNTVVFGLDENDNAQKYEFLDENTLAIPITSNGYTHTQYEEIMLRSFETALCASNIQVDGYNIVYPENDSDEWSYLSRNWSRFQYTYWYPFKKLDKLTITDADKRVRNYLNTTYKTRKEKDIIYIEAENFSGEGYLILNTNNGKIKACNGVKYKKIEEDVFLLIMTRANATVKIEKNDKMSIK